MGIFDKLKTGAKGIAEDLKVMAEHPLHGNAVDAITLLRLQHRDVEELFQMVEEATPQIRQALFEELADALVVHTEIEERIFYPNTRATRTDELLLEAVEEHLSIKRLLADLLETPCTDDSFEAKLQVLKDQVERHVEEEEEQLFPRVRSLLTQARLLELGGLMEAMAARLQEIDPRHDLAGQTDAPAPI